jgi:ribose transport system permease protein
MSDRDIKNPSAEEPRNEAPVAAAGHHDPTGVPTTYAPGQGPAPTEEGAGRGNIARQILANLGPKKLSAVYLLIFFLILFRILAPETFLTGTTIQLVLGEGVVTCLIALAFLVPLAAGSYDLSVGAMLGFALSISIYISIHSGLPAVPGAIVAVLACALVGAVNGFVIIKLRVNSLITTLAASQILLAAVLLISNNEQLVGSFAPKWSEIGNGKAILGIPNDFLFLAAIALVLWFILEHTPIGRYLLATGGNPEAARLSGVPVDRMIWSSMIVAGFLAGLAGVVYSMRTGVFNASTGPGYLFPAITAVFLGASQLSQRPNVWGTLIAYFALAFGVQGIRLSAESASVWINPAFQGVALIIAVAIASRNLTRRSYGV